MTTLRIQDIRIRSPFGKCLVTEHPYYQSLNSNDGRIYNRFLRQSKKHQQKKASGDWRGFVHLVRKIRAEGFQPQPEHPIILKKNKDGYYGTHGRHRICILRYLYGSKLLLITQRHSKGRCIIGYTIGRK